MLENIQKKWWLILLRGILIIIFGAMALMMPEIFLFTLLLYFGFLAMISGIFRIIEGIAVKDGGRGLHIFEGIVSIIFGIMFIAMPQFVSDFIMYFIAFWAIIIGIIQIIYAVRLRKEINNELMAVLNGVITLIFGILVLTNVYAGAMTVIMLLGIFALISGFLMIGLSFKVKRLGKSG